MRGSLFSKVFEKTESALARQGEKKTASPAITNLGGIERGRVNIGGGNFLRYWQARIPRTNHPVIYSFGKPRKELSPQPR
jgi:hypothetical protein